MNVLRRKASWIEGYLYISPWLLGLIIFTLYPMAYSLYLSFTEWDFIGSIKWVGIKNYVDIFTKDTTAWHSLWTTFIYTIFSVPLRLILALIVAIMLTKPYRGSNTMRLVFYLPGIISGVAVATVWKNMFDPYYGALNDILARLGLPGIGWINDVKFALPSIILMNLMYIGTQMVVFIAGLKDIPVNLYEAATIDGASPFSRFKNITLPMMSPILFFNLIMAIIQSFQVFTSVYVMTNGGPANSTLVYVLYLYQTAFQYLRMGYGAALAWILFLVTLIMTLMVFRTSGWVYFEGKGELDV